MGNSISFLKEAFSDSAIPPKLRWEERRGQSAYSSLNKKPVDLYLRTVLLSEMQGQLRLRGSRERSRCGVDRVPHGDQPFPKGALLLSRALTLGSVHWGDVGTRQGACEEQNL